MQVFESSSDLRNFLQELRQSGKSIGLVPTMGNLHSGHLALVETAKQHCDYVISTIFVNPMQFGKNEDFSRYPKTIDQDQQHLKQAKCDALFIPSVDEMYPNGLDQQTIISVPEVSNLHCGKSRPGHFDGVCTVVSKLFNLTSPDKAFFGSKDFQQLFIIKKMLADLCIPIQIIDVPIVRDDNGLALSSRNSYLSDDAKKTASLISKNLFIAKEKILNEDQYSIHDIEQAAIKSLTQSGMEIDYFTICSAHTLHPAQPKDHSLVILAAVYLEQTRLIDNIEVTLSRL